MPHSDCQGERRRRMGKQQQGTIWAGHPRQRKKTDLAVEAGEAEGVEEGTVEIAGGIGGNHRVAEEKHTVCDFGMYGNRFVLSSNVYAQADYNMYHVHDLLCPLIHPPRYFCFQYRRMFPQIWRDGTILALSEQSEISFVSYFHDSPDNLHPPLELLTSNFC